MSMTKYGEAGIYPRENPRQATYGGGIGKLNLASEQTTAQVLCYRRSSHLFHPRGPALQKPNGSPIGVLLAEDAGFVRSAIKRLLEAEPNIKLLGEAADFPQTLHMVEVLKPTVVLMDLHMPGEHEVSPALVRSRVSKAGARLLVMSIWNDDEARALAESYGAVALLDKATIASGLIEAILGLG
jgi:CheY-like chemotaxis protein